ncbi:AtpZ/AtpI family protein [Rivularia sp. UHCC 0363]|uniref:AtpZ/AtpI family protein n=1 Tax=Rivularia sp. UHCC 0363 TaxID=3110244 RepID=UPI002B1FDEDD|nr:AtpZ/AtpI family protein [Rivularia sp. UHCC 0363]MEA5594037.1 AtpZ/AtpI family protein [Rivularia sp. UHCC 0363]
MKSKKPHEPWEDFEEQVNVKSKRKLKARREGNHTVWFGLGMFGIIGWSIAVPTLLGIALGVWIDAKFPSQYSWTLMLLFVGVVFGCINAWYWIEREGGDD